MTAFDKTSKIWRSAQVSNAFPDVHLSEIILENLKKTPSRTLQIFEENGSRMTCGELRLKATRVAQNLRKLGLTQGDVVGFNCNNSENICALLNGCIFIGAIFSPMSTVHDKNDLIRMWSQTKPKFVFCDSEVYEKVGEVLRFMKSTATVCTLNERRDDVLFVEDVLAKTGKENDFEAIRSEGNNLIYLSSSSGTTGPAKAVCISQSFVLRFADMFQGAELRFVNFSPIFWSLSLLLFIILPLTKLVRVVTTRLASIENYVELIDRFKVEYLFTTPQLLHKFLQSPLAVTANLSSLKVVASAGAICHPDLRTKFKEIFKGKQLVSSYGSTEIVFAWPRFNDANDGYGVGRLLPNTEIKIVDEFGNNLGVGETGEILAKTNFPFSGYYENTETTLAAIDNDQFFRTGDVGYMNADGILNIVDRKKDIFKYHMHHINPAEIENVIQSLDGVEQVSVVGIPHQGTLLSCAVVVRLEGYDYLTEDDVVKYVANRLPDYKQLHGGVSFVKNMPTTPTGKIIRRLVAEFAEEEYQKKKHLKSEFCVND